MNCPMCGELWNRVFCFECDWTERGTRIPSWWKICRNNGHEIAIHEAAAGHEWWCSDCSRGETVSNFMPRKQA